MGCRGSGCSRNTCGSGLVHESGGSGQKSVSDPLLSRASPLPQEICGWDPGAAEKLVGVGLLTKAEGQVKNLYLTHCLREQARSHRRFVGWRDPGAAEKPVGVGLLTKAAGQVKHLYLTHCLREQARSHRRFVGCRGSGCSRKTCGSGLAHESGGSGQKSVSDTLPSQTDSLPHRLAHRTMADCCSGHFHPPAWPGAA